MQTRVDLAGMPDEPLFAAWQSAHTVAAAEVYYRAMYVPTLSSWNLRERHMADTLDRLLVRLSALSGRTAKLVVWAHNIHQGDARATDQAAAGEVSIGQLMRERHAGEVALVGFSTYSGTVRAADGWGGRDRVMRLRPALAASWSAQLHRVGLPAFLLTFADQPALAAVLAQNRLERAVGVSYLPHDERASHYFRMRLSRQFDALIHWDTTTALAVGE
jgi:erythromycin esterase-like protein